MSVVEEFRTKANECFARASRLADPEYRGLYYDLAVQWLALAAEVDARVSGPLVPGPD